LKKYISLKFYIPEEHQDTFIGMVSDLDITGIEQSNDELTINFLANIYNDTVAKELSEIANNMGVEIHQISNEIVEEKNWNEEWEKTLEPVIIGENLVIAPLHKAAEFEKYDYLIKINPKMSFGTGYHATTRLASRLILETNVNDEFWYDAGTGTGVLAILLAQRGATSVCAFDIDEWSVKNCIENVEVNSVKNITVLQSDLNTLHLEPCNGIVANIFANILIENMYKFSNALASKGILICTGILKYDKLKVLEAANSNGLTLIEELAEDEWIAYKFEKAV
jgi:ribosomal protein L11 methyltransferase